MAITNLELMKRLMKSRKREELIGAYAGLGLGDGTPKKNEELLDEIIDKLTVSPGDPAPWEPAAAAPKGGFNWRKELQDLVSEATRGMVKL